MECHYNYVLTNNNFCSTVVLIEQDFKFCQFQFFFNFWCTYEFSKILKIRILLLAKLLVCSSFFN